MPPKESKETKTEILDLIDQVKNYWPEFVINSEVLLHPTTAFVTNFYTDVIIDLNEKISFVLNEEVPNNDLDGKEFNYEVNLFCEMSRFFKKLKVDTFCINDILRPVPKRTRFFIQTAMHFLIYTDNYLQTAQKLTDDIFKQLEEKEKLYTEKQELLQQISQDAEDTVKAKEEHNKLLIERENVSKEMETMLNEKHEKEKVYNDMHLQKEKLTQECEMEEYKLTCLENEESNLKEQLISEEDYEGLKNMEKALKEELQKLSSDDCGLGDGVNVEIDNLEFIESCVSSLEKINLETLSKNNLTLKELEDSEKTNKNEIDINSTEINHLQSDVEEIKNKIEKLSDALMARENQFMLTQKLTEEQLNHVKAEHELQNKLTSDKIKKAEEHKANIENFEQDKDRILQDRKYFKTVFAAEYKKILDNKRDLVNTVYRMLSKLRDELPN